MARKGKSERKPPPRAGAEGVGRASGGSSSRLSRLLIVAAVVVALVAVGANLFPQLWKSGGSDLYISRHEVLERKRFDVRCHLKKVRLAVN
jgi:hypothetical protein